MRKELLWIGVLCLSWGAGWSAPLPGEEIARLERLASQVGDVDDIKRLQRIYGYYLDRSDWDNVVALLTDDVTMEYGPGGIYVGKAHARALLYGIGYGKPGLRPAQIREHIQLQPVVTLAADGVRAKGRWKVLALLGQYQDYARWQTGPYENEYRKEHGKWKISAIHWVETFTVPFAGGWKTSLPQSNVADRRLPPPDRPSSFSYEPWPATSLLPYHYGNPVTSAIATKPSVLPVGQMSRADARRLTALEAQVELLDDERQIQILQRTYGYYVDRNLWSQVADLFVADGTLEIGGRGVFVGKARVLQYLEWLGQPSTGRLYDHTQMQPVVHVSPDGNVAKGRWRALVFGSDLKRPGFLGDCIYENEYRKEEGVWKIARLHAYFIMYTDFDKGWGVHAWPNTRPEKELPPDRPPTVVYDMYPGTITAPLHYPNPVTGGPVFPATSESAVRSRPATATAADLVALGKRIEMLSDTQAVERLQNVYGYYLDKWQWDEAANLFSTDGSREEGLRGVYSGKTRVRASFDLQGPQGLRQREVNEHAQYQPVIHVAADGATARARVRELSLLGSYGGNAFIGSGVRENEYVKEGGIWKIRRDHLYTTFLADYEKGWVAGAIDPAGQSVSLPPDLPPSAQYKAFPAFHVVPFHYDNPVTGRPVITAR